MGFLSGLGRFAGKALKKVVPKVANLVPGGGLVKTAVSTGVGIAKKAIRRHAKKAVIAGVTAGAGALGLGALGGGGGGSGSASDQAIMAATGGSPMGGARGFRSYRRINPGNARALRRAIRRVEAGARLFGKFFSMKKGTIKGARGVRVKKLSIRRAA